MRALAVGCVVSAVAIATACTVNVDLGNPGTFSALLEGGVGLGQCPTASETPVELAAEPTDMIAFAADEMNAYWAVYEEGAQGSVAVKRVPLVGGQPATIAHARHVTGLAAVGGSVFFGEHVNGKVELREVSASGASAARGRGPLDRKGIMGDLATGRIVVASERPNELLELGPGGGSARTTPLGDTRLTGPFAMDEGEVYAVAGRAEEIVNTNGATPPTARVTFEVLGAARQGAGAVRPVLGQLQGSAGGIAVDETRVWVATQEKIIGVNKAPSRTEAPITIDGGGLYPHALRSSGGWLYWLRSRDNAVVRHPPLATGDTEVVQAKLGEGYLTDFVLTRCALVFTVISSSSSGVTRSAIHRRPRP